MTTKTADTSKSLLTHLMIAGTAALAGSAANAQIVVTNVNENIGFAPGDVSSFVSSLPGPVQFNIYRHSSSTGFARSVGMQSKRVRPIPSSVSAYLYMKANRPSFGFYPHKGGRGSVEIEVVPAGKKWGSIRGFSTSGSARVVRAYHSTTTVFITTVGGSTDIQHIPLPTTTASRPKFTDGYFAFAFTDANRDYQLDYGWIKASLTDNSLDGLNLHISSYAYDPTGAQIAMGDVGATGATVPEPNAALALAALSALTLGAVGVKRFKALQPTREANR